jgi:hypothetical protein
MFGQQIAQALIKHLEAEVVGMAVRQAKMVITMLAWC